MNLPNRLTILRTLMIPVFLFFLLTDYAGNCSCLLYTSDAADEL